MIVRPDVYTSRLPHCLRAVHAHLVARQESIPPNVAGDGTEIHLARDDMDEPEYLLVQLDPEPTRNDWYAMNPSKRMETFTVQVAVRVMRNGSFDPVDVFDRLAALLQWIEEQFYDVERGRPTALDIDNVTAQRVDAVDLTVHSHAEGWEGLGFVSIQFRSLV